jgi:transcriptional regulator
MIMYVPSHFAVTDRKTQLELIERYSFGTLTTVSAGHARISTIPFLLGRDGASLDGHVARANTHWQDFAGATDVLVGFIGPNAYISPTWYRSANMVPTWNYVAVEVRGRIELLDDLAARLDVVDRLSAKYEAHLPKPWHSAKMDAKVRAKLLAAIVAFRVRIESIEAKAKLGQNREPEDLLSAAAALETSAAASNERRLAALMRDAIG